MFLFLANMCLSLVPVTIIQSHDDEMQTHPASVRFFSDPARVTEQALEPLIGGWVATNLQCKAQLQVDAMTTVFLALV